MAATVIPFPKTSIRPSSGHAVAGDLGAALADLQSALADQRQALGEWRYAMTELSIGVADLGFALEGYQQGLDDAKKRLAGLRDEATRLGAWSAATG